MRISITKKDRRHRLTCWREDGICETADLGPSLPYHDLAHLVVERRLGLRDGFFGRMASGHSVAQLSDREAIRNSPPGALVAEVAARALQSLANGACRKDQLPELVRSELSRWSLPSIDIRAEQAEEMLVEFQALVHRFTVLQVSESIELEFHSDADEGQTVFTGTITTRR